jgi:hypothetical protein
MVLVERVHTHRLHRTKYGVEESLTAEDFRHGTHGVPVGVVLVQIMRRLP